MGSERTPNVLVIIADDLGWSDVGCFGSEISTPNLDRLSQGGVRFTQFHTASACSPTRSMLMSGTDNHIAGLGQMAETIRRFPDLFKGQPGYEGYLNDRVAALPEILSDNGYRTFMSGKWHLGLEPGRIPFDRGFNESFALLPGAGNHYAFEPKTEDGKPAIAFLPLLYYRNGKKLDQDTDLPSNFYSSDTFTDEMIDMLENHQKSGSEKPFFAYVPFTAPHWPLQADDDEIAEYLGKYDDGPDVLRAQRLERQIELGLIPANVVPHPVTTTDSEWADKTPSERAFSSKTMSIYAAMVTRLDKNIGRLLDWLDAKGLADDTFVFFSSDNGADGAILEAAPILGGRFKQIVSDHFDNSYENIGKKNSFIWYGPRWAQAATAPSRLSKGYTSEGGIRCPAILRLPKSLNSWSGTISHEFCTIMDILPTVLDLAHIKHPGTQFRGRSVVTPRGVSWLPYFSGAAREIHPNEDETYFTGWELFGQQAVRSGNWKALFIPEPRGPGKWQLYNLSEDLGEVNDLADAHPEILERLVNFWAEYEGQCGLVILPESEKVRVGYM